MMKKITMIFILIFMVVQIAKTDNYDFNVYSFLECTIENGDYKCDEKDVDYKIYINTTLNWFFIFEKNDDKSLTKLIEMDLTESHKISEYIWSYDLVSVNGYNYYLTLDLKRSIIILTPVFKIDEKIKFEIMFFKFTNPKKI